MRIVVADAGPLIIFGKTCGIELIRAVVEEILVPPAVVSECIDEAGKPGAIAIRQAIREGLLTVLEPAPVSGAACDLLLLDDGEKEALAAAHARHCAVLLDETVARSVASKIGVQAIGSLGILLKAKRLGAIAAIAPIIEEWKAANYFLGDRLVADVLRRAGETSVAQPGASP